jgi:hypothetical protein
LHLRFLFNRILWSPSDMSRCLLDGGTTEAVPTWCAQTNLAQRASAELKTSAFRPEQALPEPLVQLPVLLADVPLRPERERVRLGRRDCQRLPARERPRDVEPVNQLRFRRTEAARCCARA